MVMEIGIDIEKNERFKDLAQNVLERTFTKNELEFAYRYKNFYEQLCAMWCVKEATVKAFSNLKIPFLEIELVHTPSGKPEIVKNKTIKAELEKLGLNEIKVSLSHSKDYATAVVLIY